MIDRINHVANVCNITRNAVINTSNVGDMYDQMAADLSYITNVPYIT
jgi:hypothetical protein